MPKVSVIIPVYNVEKYLRECLDSVVNQTLKDIEIICVDDGSTDGSLAILKEYAARDERLVIIEQEHHGPGKARNVGFNAAKSPYIFYLDSDDWLKVECLEKLYNKITQDCSDICIYGGIKYDNQTNEYSENSYFGLGIYKDNINNICTWQDIKSVIFTRVNVFLKIYNKDFLLQNNIFFEEGVYYEDVLPHVKCVLSAKKITFLDELMYYYRANRSGSIMNLSKTSERVFDVYKFLEGIYNYLTKISTFEDLEEEFCKYVLSQFKFHSERIERTDVYIQFKKEFNKLSDNVKLKGIMDKYPKLLKKYSYLFPKVSVIIPVYNVEKYLRECLDSVVNQTLRDIEIICVDDGSTDGSLAILKEYAARDERIIIIEQENQGAGTARNKGLEIAIGEYLSFLDSDDFYPNNFVLRRLYESAIKYNVMVCGGCCKELINNDIVTPKRADFCFATSSMINFIDYQYIYGFCRYIYNRKFLKRHNICFPEYRIFEDPIFCLKALHKAKSFYVVNDDVHIYRIIPKDKNYKGKILTDLAKGMKAVLDYAKDNKLDKVYSDLIKRILSPYYATMFQHFNIDGKDCFNYMFDSPILSDSQIEHIEDFFDENVVISLLQDREYLRYLFKNIESFEDRKQIPNLIFLWGWKMFAPQPATLKYAVENNIPFIRVEDGFIRSADTWCNTKVDKKYIRGVSFTFTNDVFHYDATQSSYMERQINDHKFKLNSEQYNRARDAINFIIKNYLTKYNHQPIYTPNIGRVGVSKVLVVDQSYGDFSISKGLADENTFKEMLDAAIKENPEADIIVKTHPDALALGSQRASGYYSNLKSQGNVYVLREPINPISLINYVDKVYVCTTQLGFEALMCGKEVHTFGMPFYAGWGLTIDKLKNERRTIKRTLEELFYIIYIKNTHYVDPISKTPCSIERAMQYLIDLRTEYHNKQVVQKKKNKNIRKRSFLESIFSVRNENTRKVITMFGIKVKFKRKNKLLLKDDYSKFIYHNVKRKSVLLVEINSYHGECLPGIAKYFLDLGYNVDVLLNQKEYSLNPFSNYFKNKISVFVAAPAVIKKILCSSIIEQYDYLYINSDIFIKQSINEYIGCSMKYPLKSIIVMCHHPEFYDNIKFKTEKICIATLADFPVLVDKKYSYINTHYYDELKTHSKNKITQFIVVGNIHSYRKNHNLIVETVEKLSSEGINNFKIIIIARTGKLDIPENISQFFEFKSNLSYKEMYKELSSADFLLTLFDPENCDHDRYIYSGSSGSYQLSYGFNIPLLIPYKFQIDVNGFNSLNSIGYNDNSDFIKAMRFCINMENEQYVKYKSNLSNLEKEIYQKSLNNLKKITMKYANCNINILQYLFSVKNDDIRKVITILGIKFKLKSKKLINRKKEKKLNDKIEKMSKTIQSQDKLLKSLKGQIINQESGIIESQKQINSQNAYISDLKNIVNDLSQDLNSSKSKISKQQEQIANQHKQSIDKVKREYEYKLCKYMHPSMYPVYIKDWYKRATGEVLNLDNPQTFNEKIQWMKLYDSTPIKTRLADKYLVRNWVREKIGEEYLIPLLGVWDSFDEIDFDSLPDKFVLKCNHGSGYNIIVTDKSKLDIEDARKKINNWMNEDYAFKFGLELHYSPIPRKIIAEEYLAEISNSIYDYRFFCTYGKCIQIWLDKDSGTPYHERKIYDKDWNELDITVKWPRIEGYIEKPSKLGEMIQFAEKMSSEFSLVRVDFYFVNNKIYFGEMTFTSMSGTGKFEPIIEGYKLGQQIHLPIENKEFVKV